MTLNTFILCLVRCGTCWAGRGRRSARCWPRRPCATCRLPTCCASDTRRSAPRSRRGTAPSSPSSTQEPPSWKLTITQRRRWFYHSYYTNLFFSFCFPPSFVHTCSVSFIYTAYVLSLLHHLTSSSYIISIKLPLQLRLFTYLFL